jgi:hypothetical protein
MSKKILSDEIRSITRQFFIETKGGTQPDQVTKKTKENILKNIKTLKKLQTPKTPGVGRMMKIFLNSPTKDKK